MKQTIHCPTCGGTGVTALPEHLQGTLNAMPKNGKTIAQSVRERMGSTATLNSISGHLRELHSLGFVKRERFGKFWKYSRA